MTRPTDRRGSTAASRSRPVLPAAARTGLWMAVSSAGFAVMVTLVRQFADQLDVYTMVFWRNLFAALVFVPWLLHVGARGMRTRRLRLYLGRSLLIVVSTILLYLGVTMMPLADATALSFSSPLFATVLAVLILRESVGLPRWSALLAGLVGVLIILRPGAGSIDPAAVVILASSIAFAGVVITGKQLASTETPELIVLYLSVFSVPFAFIPAVLSWHWPSPHQFLILLAISAAAVVNMYGLARALKIGDASMAMPFDFVRLLFTAMLGYLIFGERPDFWTWTGALLIFGSAIFVAHREGARARLAMRTDAARITPSRHAP